MAVVMVWSLARHRLMAEGTDMIDKSGIVVLDIRRETSGLFIATSSQLDGVYLAHRNLDAILDDVPQVVKLWFKSNKNADVEVFCGPLTQYDGSAAVPMIPIPAEIAASALRG